MMNKTCKECQLSEWRERCDWTSSIGVFLEHLMETHSVPVIHECPLHRKCEEYEEKENEMEQLKPCPFCGGVAEIEKREEKSINEQRKY